MDCCCSVAAAMQGAHPWGTHMGSHGIVMAGGSGMQRQVPCQQGATSMGPFLWATACTSRAAQWAAVAWWVLAGAALVSCLRMFADVQMHKQDHAVLLGWPTLVLIIKHPMRHDVINRWTKPPPQWC